MINYKQLHYFWAVAKAGSIARAGRQLHLTPQTISGQIGLLEESLGMPLFRRVGRGLEMTETGLLALTYAEDIFQAGSELEEALRGRSTERPRLFRVGIADVVPKSIAYRLLAPAMALAEPVRIICREGKLEPLLGELAIHRLDLVLADRAMPSEMDIKGRSHRLGECGMSVFGTVALAQAHGADFPHGLDGAPMLIPGEDSAVRGRLMRWFGAQRIRPRVVGEFDDGALMHSFGQAGVGLFVAPTAIAGEVERQYGVKAVGRVDEVVERFYAISVERRAGHPAVIAINAAAPQGLES